MRNLTLAEVERIVVKRAEEAGLQAAEHISDPSYNDVFLAAFDAEAERAKQELLTPERRTEYDLRGRHASGLMEADVVNGGVRVTR